MAKKNDLSDSGNQTTKATCGIVMPIAAMGDNYTVDHWRRVRKIHQRAIEMAGLEPKLVWENSEVDVIQSAILQNLYENDVVVCDVSGLNPNVMLEAGLRLSTKRPTVIVTDRVVKPPFDISTIGYIDYQKDLEYNAIEDFIKNLSEKIVAVNESYASGNYKSFVEQFKFETVDPQTVSVPADEYLADQIQSLTTAVARIERNLRGEVAPSSRRRHQVLRMTADLTSEIAANTEADIDSRPEFEISAVSKNEDGKYVFQVPITAGVSVEDARKLLRKILDDAELDSIQF